jgi:hypothetical protein
MGWRPGLSRPFYCLAVGVMPKERVSVKPTPCLPHHGDPPPPCGKLPRGPLSVRTLGSSLLRHPNSATLAARYDLDTRAACALMTYRMSVLSDGNARGRGQGQCRFHAQFASQRRPAPQCAAAESLTLLHVAFNSSNEVLQVCHADPVLCQTDPQRTRRIPERWRGRAQAPTFQGISCRRRCPRCAHQGC